MRRLMTWWRGTRRDPRRADLVDMTSMLVVGTVLVAAGLVGLWPVGVSDPVGSGRWWFLLTLAAIAPLVLIRRSRPFLGLAGAMVVVAVDMSLGGSLGVVVVLVDLMYSAARHGSAEQVRWLSRGLGVTIVGAAIVTWSLTGAFRAGLFAGLQAFAVLGTPVWWAMSVRQEAALAQAAEEVAALERQRAADLARLAELREQESVRRERARMARDLHDVIASHVSAVAIHAEAALARRPNAEADRAALGTMRSASVTALAEMRAMISLLRAPGSDEADSATTAPRLDRAGELVAASRATGLAVEAELDLDGVGELAAATEQAAYRILQEALTNAVKHASGPVEVGVRRSGGDLLVEVRSRGERDIVTSAGGLGLVSMRERAEALGGSFSAGWEDGHWVVRAGLPALGTAA